MSQQTITAAVAPTRPACDPTTSVTRTLLGYGAVAGPCYVAVSVTQGLTRAGFDFTRHQWSLLANGGLGWIQITNFVLTGLMCVAFAAGLRRALRPGTAATWAPRLVAAYGVGLICAGAFRADPALGFPPGTPASATPVSWHGILHLLAGGIGFACLIAACFVVARRFGTEGRPGWARYSRVTGVLFLVGFGAVASGVGNAGGTTGTVVTLAFVTAVVLAWTWMAAVAVHLYRRAY
jgi:Protein of unknown function (DUF998)